MIFQTHYLSKKSASPRLRAEFMDDTVDVMRALSGFQVSEQEDSGCAVAAPRLTNSS